MLKKAILTASTAIVAVSSANAQNTLASAELRGNGASSIVNVLNQELNCLGGTNQPTAFGGSTTTAGTTGSITQFFYDNGKAPSPSNTYNCDTVSKPAAFDGSLVAGSSVQPNITGKYVSTGSGGGRDSFLNANASGIPSNPFGTWTNIHFAFSDSPLTSSHLSTYNGGAAFTKGGAAIQVPLFVLPVAIAYAESYGKIRHTDNTVKTLKFNVVKPRADGSGGLKLSQTTLCGIMNGTITNWNDPALATDNGGVSLGDALDPSFATTGVPIRLVGRSDKSGTTNIFTRAMTAQCGGDFTAGGTDTLPTARVAAGVTYDPTTGALTGSPEVSGKFGVVSGSNGIDAVLERDPGTPTATIGNRVLNGSLGYNGADWVKPSSGLSGSVTLSADLVNANNGTAYAPSAKNASTAFGTILPPESDSKGKFAPGVSNGIASGQRNDPLAWVVPANATGVGSLANPSAGYPITGSTQILTYTCYADAAVRNALQHFITFHFAKITKDSTLAKYPANLVKGTGKPLGILAASGIAPMPANWIKAIQSTFLKKVGNAEDPTKEASLGLYIQSNTQTKDSTASKLVANPSCAEDQGGDDTHVGI